MIYRKMGNLSVSMKNMKNFDKYLLLQPVFPYNCNDETTYMPDNTSGIQVLYHDPLGLNSYFNSSAIRRTIVLKPWLNVFINVF